jgi:ribulose-phosphate 3-epimerase
VFGICDLVLFLPEIMKTIYPHKNTENLMKEAGTGRVLIAPSLLSANFASLREDIKEVEAAGCRILHLDVMDGHFVPNLTIGPVVIESIRRVTDLYFDVHLMIEDPACYLKSFADSGADGITIHQEIETDCMKVLKEIREMGIDAGISLRPGTEVDVIEPMLDLLDRILIMSVEPGFGGQGFIPGSKKKIAAARRLTERVDREIIVAIDGGINIETAPIAARAGATELIAGSAVFKGNIGENITALRESVRGVGSA